MELLLPSVPALPDALCSMELPAHGRRSLQLPAPAHSIGSPLQGIVSAYPVDGKDHRYGSRYGNLQTPPSGETHGPASLPDAARMMKLSILGDDEEKKGLAFSVVDNQVFSRLVDRCISQRSMADGMAIQCLMIGFGLDSDEFLAGCVIRMFAYFGRLAEAQQVFSRLAERNVFSWNAIISAHVRLGHNEKAIKLFLEMLDSRTQPNGHVFMEVLKSFSYMGDLEECKMLHAFIVESGFELDVYIGNTLIDTYGSCRESIDDAFRVFSRLESRDIVSWNTLIMAYSRCGYVQKALYLFRQLSLDKMEPNHVTFLSILKDKSLEAGLESGMEIHAYAIQYGLEINRLVGNSLISMYVKHKRLDAACLLSEKLPKRNHVTYNALLAGCAQNGNGQAALRVLGNMLYEGIEPDCYTFVSFLKGYARTGNLDQILWAYSYIVEGAFEADDYIASALVSALMKHGKLDDAQRVFNLSKKQNVVIWSALIDGYVQSGCAEQAFHLFNEMKHQHGMSPGPVTYASLLKACTSLEHDGKWIHAQIIEDAIESDQFVASSLIDMYARCEKPIDACLVFERLVYPNIVVCSALIIGLTRQGHGHKALMLFDRIRREEHLDLDEVAYVNVINACSQVSALVKGREVHAHIIGSGLRWDSFVGSSLIDMYSNCGSFDDAYCVFNLLDTRTAVTWNAAISACARNNDYILSDKLFNDMVESGSQPEEITFICVLSACSRGGLVDNGCLYLRSMMMTFGMSPALEHMNSMVDILSQAKKWEEAEDLLETIPFACNTVGWMSLLSSCRTHTALNVGKRCFSYVVQMDPAQASGYVLMSNIYARSGLRENAEAIDELRLSANGWKKPGKAFVEVNNFVHDFSVDDRHHSHCDEIREKLKVLSVQMKQEGYKPCTDLVLGPLSTEEKEDALNGHCEKLAVAFGLISTPPGTTIRIAKNLRVCIDCHSATKAISKIERREIIIADTHCVHKFNNGMCSCCDAA